MSKHDRSFKVFFSYARADANADPHLIRAFTEELETRLSLGFANDSIAIWKDTTGLRLGDRWEPEIEKQLESSDVLMVLLTPRWLGSDKCIREYELFETHESTGAIGDYVPSYVAPILARDVEKERSRLTDKQSSVYDRIVKRQYKRVLANDFLSLPQAGRTAILDEIADDIRGMALRRANAPQLPGTRTLPPRARGPKEFDVPAHNYNDVDFIANAEVVIDQSPKGAHNVLAQCDFVERLYVSSSLGRIEFGVRRAFLSIENQGPGHIEKIESYKGSTARQNASYITLRDFPKAISICMDPAPGKSALSELALPPAPNENYHSIVAKSSPDIIASQVKAHLTVTLNVEGLYLPEHKRPVPSQKTLNSIKAIMEIALTKAAHGEAEFIQRSGQVRRAVPVRAQG